MPTSYVSFGYPTKHLTLANFVRALVLFGDLPREFTRSEFTGFGCFCTDYSMKYINSFLSNCEINSTHSPTYPKFVERVSPGVYRLVA